MLVHEVGVNCGVKIGDVIVKVISCNKTGQKVKLLLDVPKSEKIERFSGRVYSSPAKPLLAVG
jgi:hypothetical protein